MGPWGTVHSRQRERRQSERQVSAVRSFRVADGEMATFECRGPLFWLVYVAALVRHAPLIILKPE